ncbi:SU10 major capsid protein [Streptomyces hydrogenans]|uniref:SU10 major capsid protein n=1 Tax=Streptomyces hydrogenans TaxID=1873719 RepID=UPI00406BD99E
MCAPVWLEIPGKGMLFAEPLAKVGASEKWQLYGEVGLEYGPESYHGLITDLK